VLDRLLKKLVSLTFPSIQENVFLR
jgi:hypothetical protein